MSVENGDCLVCRCADDQVGDESEENIVIRYFAQVCTKRMKVNKEKCKRMRLGGEEVIFRGKGARG